MIIRMLEKLWEDSTARKSKIKSIHKKWIIKNYLIKLIRKILKFEINDKQLNLDQDLRKKYNKLTIKLCIQKK